jgi:acyl carrier protein
LEKKKDQEIVDYLVSMLDQKFHVPLSKLETSNWNEPLTGAFYGLNGIDLTYLFLEIEKHYLIKVDEEFLRSYGFSSINKIIKVIKKCM